MIISGNGRPLNQQSAHSLTKGVRQKYARDNLVYCALRMELATWSRKRHCHSRTTSSKRSKILASRAGRQRWSRERGSVDVWSNKWLAGASRESVKWVVIESLSLQQPTWIRTLWSDTQDYDAIIIEMCHGGLMVAWMIMSTDSKIPYRRLWVDHAARSAECVKGNNLLVLYRRWGDRFIPFVFGTWSNG